MWNSLLKFKSPKIWADNAGLPRWVSPFGNPRINACSTAPRGLSQSRRVLHRHIMSRHPHIYPYMSCLPRYVSLLTAHSSQLGTNSPSINCGDHLPFALCYLPSILLCIQFLSDSSITPLSDRECTPKPTPHRTCVHSRSLAQMKRPLEKRPFLGSTKTRRRFYVLIDVNCRVATIEYNFIEYMRGADQCQ